MIISAQLRAARGLVGWSQSELAKAAGVGLSTIRRMEKSEDTLRGTAESVWKIQHALESAGIIFIDDDESAGPGVRLKKG